MSKVQYFFSLKCATNHAIFTCLLSHLKNHSKHIPKPSIPFKSQSKSIKPIFNFSSTLEPINRALIPHNLTHQKVLLSCQRTFLSSPYLACIDELFFSSPSVSCPFGISPFEKVPLEFCLYGNFCPFLLFSYILFLFSIFFYFYLAF